jgi:transcription initiation factor TFIIIB Brf1 subunit/transcription initiation factor TFIIB
MGECNTDIKQCMHDINGEKDGFIVCFECGLILENHVYESGVIENRVNDIFLPPLSLTSIKFTANKHKIEDVYMTNLCDNLNEICARNLISHEVKNLCVFYIKHWKDKKIPYRKDHLYYAIYYCCRLKNYPFSLKEICNYFKISTKNISRLEKIIPLENSAFLSCGNYVEKYCSRFELSYTAIQKVKEVCLILEQNYNIQPVILIGCVISVLHADITQKSITNKLNISPATIKKWKDVVSNFLQDSQPTRAKEETS